MRPEANVGADDGVGADVGVGADLRGGIDDRSGMNAGRISRRLIEESQCAREGVVGILDAKRGGGDLLKFRLDDTAAA